MVLCAIPTLMWNKSLKPMNQAVKSNCQHPKTSEMHSLVHDSQWLESPANSPSCGAATPVHECSTGSAVVAMWRGGEEGLLRVWKCGYSVVTSLVFRNKPNNFYSNKMAASQMLTKRQCCALVLFLFYCLKSKVRIREIHAGRHRKCSECVFKDVSNVNYPWCSSALTRIRFWRIKLC